MGSQDPGLYLGQQAMVDSDWGPPNPGPQPSSVLSWGTLSWRRNKSKNLSRRIWSVLTQDHTRPMLRQARTKSDLIRLWQSKTWTWSTLSCKRSLNQNYFISIDMRPYLARQEWNDTTFICDKPRPQAGTQCLAEEVKLEQNNLVMQYRHNTLPSQHEDRQQQRSAQFICDNVRLQARALNRSKEAWISSEELKKPDWIIIDAWPYLAIMNFFYRQNDPRSKGIVKPFYLQKRWDPGQKNLDRCQYKTLLCIHEDRQG